MRSWSPFFLRLIVYFTAHKLLPRVCDRTEMHYNECCTLSLPAMLPNRPVE